MKIISLHIVAFGKLKDVSLQFKGGINVIKEANSFGKTTVAGFIRAMLYGLAPARSRDVNNVARFAPWGSADRFGGSMVVEHDGESYRIERFFGATARMETLTVTNDKTGKTLNWQKQPGEILLGLTAESYDRSAFFPQEAVELAPNENMDNRLGNIVQDNAEDYDKVQEKLRAYKKDLRHERGNGGEIYKLECEKRDLTEQIVRSHSAEKRLNEIDRRLNEIEQESASLTRRCAEYSENLAKLQQIVPIKTAPIQQPQQQAKRNSKLLLYIVIALAVVGVLFLALGVMEVIGLVAYIVGGICLTCGIGGVVANIALKSSAKNHSEVSFNPHEQTAGSKQEEYERAVRDYVNILTSISQQLSELATETGRLTEERKGLQVNNVDVMDRLLTVEEQIKQAVHRYEVADMVSKLLEQAKDNLSSNYLPRLCARCSELLQEIAQNNFAVTVDRNFAIGIREKGVTQPISEFSRGIREITLLCFRIALSELLYDGAIPFIIIDDAFVNFDENNFVRATALLKKLSAHAQIIYFTCHNRMGELLK